MNRPVLAMIVALGLSAACATERPVDGEPLPAWLTGLIQQLESQPVTNPPAFIARYEYRDEVVYYLPARCCDIPSNLYNAVGTIVCHPDGGFSGTGDGRCADFFAERKNEKVLWRDLRVAA